MRRIIAIILLTTSILSCSSGDDSNEIEAQFCGIRLGNVSLRTMTEVENFAKCNYTEITGNLSIYDGNVQYPITDLSKLSSLKKIGGSLRFTQLNELTTLDGLQNIEYARSLQMHYMYKLKNLDALEKLQISSIEMSNNFVLKNIDALNIASGEMGTLAIYNHPVLENLQAFSNIKTVKYAVIIENNDALIDLSGLESIENIGSGSSPATCCGTLIIADNDNLLNLNGLSNVTEIKGTIRVFNNFYLESTAGINNLKTLKGDLIITYNTYLNNLDGFQNLTSLRGDITIHDNSLLRGYCGLHNLFLLNGHSGDYLVFNNFFNPPKSNIKNAPPCN